MKYSESGRFSYEDKSLNKYLYKLVTFVGSEDDEGKKDVDIVLSKWIRFSEEENKYFTRFPSPPYDTWTMKELNKLLKNCISAPSIWMEYEIEIENHARTFPEAQKLFGELKAEMKRKYSKKNYDKTRKSTRNSEIFNIENLFNSMNDSLLPYVLIEKLDYVASSCGTPKKNSSKGMNDSQVSPMLSPSQNTRRTRSKLRQTIDQSSTLKKLDTNNLVLSEKRGLRKRKSNDSLIEYYLDSPSKKSYKSPRNKKGVNFAPSKSDLNGNENSVENYEVTVNLTMLRQQEIERANCYNSYNPQEEDSEITVVQVHRSYSQEQEEEEEELINSIDSTRQFELPTCNSNENQNTSQIEDIENDENVLFEGSQVTVVKESYSQMKVVESNSVDSIQQYELSTSNSNENGNTSQMEITDSSENALFEGSQVPVVKESYSQMKVVATNSVDSTQQPEFSTCNSNNSENTSQQENTDNDENIFSEVITEKEKENSCLLFLRILKALNIIHLNQLDVQRTLRDIMNLAKNNDLESTFLKKFNFILPITTVDENLTMNNNNDLQQAFFAKFNLIKPISTVDEFILFDDELKSNSTFRENFTQMLNFFIDNDNTLVQCVNKILNECIAEEVRAQYNATTITESSSRIFKDTEFYKILLDSVMVYLLVGGSISLVTAREDRVATTDEDLMKILTGLFTRPGSSFILPNSIVDTHFLHSLEAFSQKLYKAVKKDNSKNVLVSALSANLALGMIAYGARGNSKSEILRMLSLEEDDDVMKSNYESLYNNVTSISGPELTIRNKLFIGGYQTIQKTYRDVVRSNFHGAVERINFAETTRAATEINRWISRATNSKINEIVTSDNLDKYTSLFGVNVIYFKGEWKNKFTVAMNMDFFTDSGEIKVVKMMYANMEIDYGYFSEIRARFVELPYKGDELKMIIVLPDINVSLEQVENSLEMWSLRDLRMKRSKKSVDMYLPKFTVESTIDLKNIVKTLDVNEVFTNEANLSGITEISLELSEIRQKIFIEVNEDGTEAAAVTSTAVIGNINARDDIVFFTNRPFHYKIIKTVGENDGIVLFAGKYKNVN